MLVDEGIHIMENLNLDEIARARHARVLFVALPLRLAGSTGSPIRPVAIAWTRYAHAVRRVIVRRAQAMALTTTSCHWA